MKNHDIRARAALILCLSLLLGTSSACGKTEEETGTSGAAETMEEVVETREERAQRLLSEEKYEEAYSVLHDLGLDEQIRESKYDRGVKLFEEGDYEAASALLTDLDYLDSEQYLLMIEAAARYSELSSAGIGETVCLGSYEQDAHSENGEEAIEWIVLDKQGDHLLLLSRYALDCVDYEPSEKAPITWEESSIKSWLNTEFFVNSFSEAEKLLIASVNTETDEFTLMDGVSDTDRVFLLSETEVNRYLPMDTDRQCFCTAYALEQGSWQTSEHICRWWLRSDGSNGVRKAGVRHQGSVYSAGFYVDIGYLSARPAICISFPA